MIDIHNHLIFSIDDGAKDMEKSLEMINEYLAQGVDCVITTPHYRRDLFPYDLGIMRAHYNELKQIIIDENLPFELYLGHEAYLNEHLLDNLINGHCLTLADSDYVLIEIPSLEFYEIAQHMLFEIADRGFIPIIAHCERLVHNREDLDKLIALKGFGYYLQVNAEAILRPNKRWLKQWIIKNIGNRVISFVASDAHGMRHRKINLGEAYVILAAEVGESLAKEVLEENQRRVIQNEII